MSRDRSAATPPRPAYEVDGMRLAPGPLAELFAAERAPEVARAVVASDGARVLVHGVLLRPTEYELLVARADGAHQLFRLGRRAPRDVPTPFSYTASPVDLGAVAAADLSSATADWVRSVSRGTVDEAPPFAPAPRPSTEPVADAALLAHVTGITTASRRSREAAMAERVTEGLSIAVAVGRNRLVVDATTLQEVRGAVRALSGAHPLRRGFPAGAVLDDLVELGLLGAERGDVRPILARTPVSGQGWDQVGVLFQTPSRSVALSVDGHALQFDDPAEALQGSTGPIRLAVDGLGPRFATTQLAWRAVADPRAYRLPAGVRTYGRDVSCTERAAPATLARFVAEALAPFAAQAADRQPVQRRVSTTRNPERSSRTFRFAKDTAAGRLARPSSAKPRARR